MADPTRYEGEAIMAWNRRGVVPGPDLMYLLALILELQDQVADLRAFVGKQT
jgi:hypothetical protein